MATSRRNKSKKMNRDKELALVERYVKSHRVKTKPCPPVQLREVNEESLSLGEQISWHEANPPFKRPMMKVQRIRRGVES